MEIDQNVLDFINRIVPEHTRTSCSDTNIYNALCIDKEASTVLSGRCVRCSLLSIAQDPSIELPTSFKDEGNELIDYL